MLTRTRMGVLVVAVWVGVLSWHVRRVLFPGEIARLEAATRTLPPGVAYYALFRGAERAGWAQLDVDTMPAATGFNTRRRLVIELPGLGSAGISEVRTEAWQGASLLLDSLTLQRVALGDTAEAAGRRIGDSLVASSLGGPDFRSTLSDEDPLFLASTWPLRFAADGRARPGDQYVVAVYDPVQALVRNLTLRVEEQASRVWTDSADLDSLTGMWFGVREDTVQAWRLTNSEGGTEQEVWVDENGRILEAPLPGGIRMERTAFEIAFFNRTQPSGDSP